MSNNCDYEYIKRRCFKAFMLSIYNPYVWANVLYVTYAAAMLVVDSCSLSKTLNNKIYFYFGIVHLINAIMYLYTWKGYGRHYSDVVLLPEYMNIIGAILYLISSALYSSEYVEGEPETVSINYYIVRHIELTASLLEVLAAIGWVNAWYIEFYRNYGCLSHPTPGRGWTFDDPDIPANITIIIASLIYLYYNIIISISIKNYQNDYTYIYGDYMYFINSIFYLLAALRDCEWFWFMPTWGRWIYLRELQQCLLFPAPITMLNENFSVIHSEESSEEKINSGVIFGSSSSTVRWDEEKEYEEVHKEIGDEVEEDKNIKNNDSSN